MAALREVVADFDVRVNGAAKLDAVDAKLNRTKASAQGLSFGFGKLGAALAGAFVVREIAGFFRAQAELGEQLETTARTTGLSVEQLQRWQFAANMMGKDSESLTQGLTFFNRALGHSGTEMGKATDGAFAKLGVKVRDSSGAIRDTNELLLEFSDGLGKLKSPAERMAMAMQIAGRGGKGFAAILGEGREATEKLLKQADEAGIVLGRDFTHSAQKAAIEGHKLDWSWRALKGTIAQQLFPWFRTIVDLITDGIKGFIGLVKHTTFAKTAIIALGVAIGLANVELLVIVAAVLAAYLVFDDLFNLFTGGKSVIGDTIDALLGVGQAQEMVNGLKAAWDELTTAIFGSGDAAGTAGGQTASALSTLKAVFAKVIDVVAEGLTMTIAGLVQVIEGVKAVYAKVSGDKEGEKTAQEHAYAASETASKAHKRFSAALDSDVGAAALRIDDKQSRTRDVEAQKKAAAGVHVTQHITVHGGDPHAVKAAVKQGTNDALAQHDIRNAYHASRSTAPAVGQ